ncbi:unnamed protein product [marine sediment metagenome]|uniref:Uncharacterized protein n=1 Tax=marine sediment metagenome TaxID=412755 RepID=X1C898_9ZZZZ
MGGEAGAAAQALASAAYALIYIARIYDLGIVVTTIGTIHSKTYII